MTAHNFLLLNFGLGLLIVTVVMKWWDYHIKLSTVGIKWFMSIPKLQTMLVFKLIHVSTLDSSSLTDFHPCECEYIVCWYQFQHSGGHSTEWRNIAFQLQKNWGFMLYLHHRATAEVNTCRYSFPKMEDRKTPKRESLHFIMLQCTDQRHIWHGEFLSHRLHIGQVS